MSSQKTSHTFTASEIDGCLYRDDERVPLRLNYRQPHRDIKTVADLKAALRYGEFAWPGGYQMYFLTSDGAALSFATVREEFRLVASAVKHGSNDGWRVVATDINWEDEDLIDDHTGKKIPSAYGPA